MRTLERTKLRRARERLRLGTAAEFAAIIGVDPSYITHVEAGRKLPTAPIVDRWLKALGKDATIELFEPQARPWGSTAEMLSLSGQD